MEDWIAAALEQLPEKKSKEIQIALEDLQKILQRENASVAGAVILMFYLMCLIRIDLDQLLDTEDFKVDIFKEIESILFDEDRLKKIKKLFGSKVDLH